MSLDSNWQKWLENIIVLGKGEVHWSKKYGAHMQCLAGVDCGGKWVRLYPIRPFDNIQLFNIINIAIDKKRPEPHRPESIRVRPESIVIVGHIGKLAQRVQLIEEFTQPGDFLHNDGWRYQSLGLIKPIRPWFGIDEGQVFAHYNCNCDKCEGHNSKVELFVKVDRYGRRRVDSADRIQSRCNKLVGLDLRFLMGTHSKYPYTWLLISIHVLSELSELLASSRGSNHAN